ncbi:hypothetical protein NDU88_008313 [Pleurodeles waltl]|uniref:Uncharacterized protein n=1 Tax=Pleurodeles waltl TaxID=8319 RepID=A0AAV7P0J7_PLEWA|nr:hypothetical protein NDU88_008313 [Pleurodeles waltl]
MVREVHLPAQHRQRKKEQARTAGAPCKWLQLQLRTSAAAKSHKNPRAAPANAAMSSVKAEDVTPQVALKSPPNVVKPDSAACPLVVKQR